LIINFNLISDEIALQFWQHRKPNSKAHPTRIMHLSNYIIDELPFILTGVELKGIHYKTFIYPTDVAKAKSFIADKVYSFAHKLQTDLEYAKVKKEIIDIGQIESTEGVTLLPIEDIDVDEDEEEEPTLAPAPAPAPAQPVATLRLSEEIQNPTRPDFTRLTSLEITVQ
jgi:hypothetical protein